ncbi:glucose-6-phosphate isomerase [Fructobacillus sp. M1-13]|uniref:Glucose-6-phosphate isomerase n=1 Tax=Fructobacillus papyriferae TaxID=2713171 RepID=A0ABS5QT28_9LACO|nr:glucose-6-phosphate isomerase [Fructobacillus papyriferae]MBS9335112.1 glucose-6-phosphate isomerase [Fructobacillus papyriferae]MCD2159402.1 glucose-6-phosphate isomerase [Fructobacillus papyriferae]
MNAIQFDSFGLRSFIKEHEYEELAPQLKVAQTLLKEKSGAGAAYTDWIDWASNFDGKCLAKIKQLAKKVQQQSRVLVVIGIGGSYLGAKMALDFLKSPWYNDLADDQETKVYFAGNQLSAMALNQLLQVIGDQDFSVNVISKSGQTTEAALAFRFFKDELMKRYGQDGAAKRIIATTDASQGTLRQETKAASYDNLVVPSGIGGRFSVLTAVGLLPLAVAGVAIDELLEGAAQAEKTYQKESFTDNPALQYAASRRILYDKGYTTEILANWEPSLQYFSEWWKQLMGESEGKNRKGIYPSSANYSTDLHSFGQYIQEGRRDLFETVVRVDQIESDLAIPKMVGDGDGLAYLEEKTLEEVNQTAADGVALAHIDGGVPNMAVYVAKQDEKSLGELIYFFEMAVAISGYLFAINPFNQPGVEAYKTAMFALLGKPGYEDETEKYRARLRHKRE